MAKYPVDEGISRFSAAALKEIAATSLTHSPSKRVMQAARVILEDDSYTHEAAWSDTREVVGGGKQNVLLRIPLAMVDWVGTCQIVTKSSILQGRKQRSPPDFPSSSTVGSSCSMPKESSRRSKLDEHAALFLVFGCLFAPWCDFEMGSSSRRVVETKRHSSSEKHRAAYDSRTNRRPGSCFSIRVAISGSFGPTDHQYARPKGAANGPAACLTARRS